MTPISSVSAKFAISTPNEAPSKTEKPSAGPAATVTLSKEAASKLDAFEDTGTMFEDTGTLKGTASKLDAFEDTGTMFEDTGTMFEDTGTMFEDTGTMFEDTGTMHTTAGALQLKLMSS